MGIALKIPTPHRAVLLFCTSASVLAYEILLMRLLSIALWHHFAYMVISVALLGFGAAGSMLFLLFEKIRSRLEGCLILLACATAISFSLAFSLSQRVGSDPLNLVWQNKEWFYMLITYLALALPFLMAGGIVGIILSSAGEQAHIMYGADLLGAGVGVVAVIPALYLGPPWALLPALGCIVLVGALWCCRFIGKPVKGMLAILVSAFLVGAVYLLMPPIPGMHHTKALPVTLSFPDARIEAERAGPLGMIHVVGSSHIRQVPGLSLNFGLGGGDKEPILPEQKAIFLDGDAPSPISRFSGNLEDLEYLDFTTMALPYHTRPPEKVLIIGGGGGSDVLLGLRHRSREMVVLEANRQVADLMLGPFAEFSGHLYSRPEVRLEVREARQYLQATEERFDLIQLSLLDSFGGASGGLHSADEDYLYTVEALALYLSRLSDSGVLAITRWLKLPPRDSFRIMATALAALRRVHLSEKPETHLLFITSWKTSTILASRAPFDVEEIRRATRFCDERSFDLAYYAGMKAERANRYDIQPSPAYFLGASAICGPDAKSFLDGYVFDVFPTTDDRPYFSHFFRWDKAADLFQHLRREWLPIVELGYLLILATLLQALVAGAMLILLPLAGLRWAGRASAEIDARPKSSDVLSTFIYFGSIGTGFMFLEMALLPKYTLILSHPIYSVSVVLCAILVFAGCGSMSMRRFMGDGARMPWVPVAIIFCWVGLHVFLGDRLFESAMGWAFGYRLALAVLLLSLLAFFLGWPFPSGLRLLSRKFPGLVPWAWGVNACASVVGAVLGKCLGVTFGFKAVMLMACALYLIGIAVFHARFKDRTRSLYGINDGSA